MATFDVPPIGLNVKPPQQTSLADMLGIARGAQQYQQAEQINPLALQQQQQAARTGQIQLGVAEQQDMERRNLQTFFSDPKNFQTDGRIDIDKINAEVPRIAPLTGPDYVQKITTLGTAQTEGLRAKQNLTQDKKALISSFLGAAGRFGVDDPAVVNRELQNFLATNPNDQEMKNLVEKAYVPIFSQMQKGPQVTDALIKASQAIMSPTQPLAWLAVCKQTCRQLVGQVLAGCLLLALKLPQVCVCPFLFAGQTNRTLQNQPSKKINWLVKNIEID